MKKVILLIEDDELISKFCGQHLEDAGYTVEYSYDGADGLKRIKELLPDLVLLDIVLPTLDGISVLRSVKTTPETKDVPVIILSNLSTGDKISEAVESGSTTYLVKSNYSLDDVVNKVNETLGGPEK